MTQWIYRAGAQRTEVLIGNVVQCWLPEGRRAGVPFGNRAPTRSEVQSCWDRHVGSWLHSWDAQFKPEEDRYLVPVGAPAARWFLGLAEGKKVERWNGTLTAGSLPTFTRTPDTSSASTTAEKSSESA